MFGDVFTTYFSPMFGDQASMRALSEGEIAQLRVQQAMLAHGFLGPQQTDATVLAQLIGMSNYRPPVHVPVGWSEWYRHGKEVV